jgi:hypothetical protein
MENKQFFLKHVHNRSIDALVFTLAEREREREKEREREREREKEKES